MTKMLTSIILVLVLLSITYPFTAKSVAASPLEITEHTFKDNQIVTYNIAALSDGKVAVAYMDADPNPNNGYGRFKIYNSDLTLASEETTFNNGRIDHITIAPLSSGNFFIIYTEGQIGKFLIYNSQGNIVRNETVFKNSNTSKLQAITLTNDNVFITYRDGMDYRGKFVILDSAGEFLGSETTFYSGMSIGAAVAPLPNGEALIIYNNTTTWELEAAKVIYNSIEVTVQTPVVINPEKTGVPHLTTMANGNLFLNYVKDHGSYTYHGYYMILNQTGEVVKTETSLRLEPSVDLVSSTLLSDQSLLVSYRYGMAGNNSAKLINLNSDGKLLRDETVVYDGVVNDLHQLTLPNGDLLISFWEGQSPHYGKFMEISNPVVNSKVPLPASLLLLLGDNSKQERLLPQLNQGAISEDF